MNVVAFRRKMIYTVLIVVLLIPLYVLGQPQSRSQDGNASGGLLSQIRSRYKIGQADLGEIDPASESMRLATLGLRGFAAAALWHKAQYYKNEFYWDRYKATLDQIALLQPHSLNVWDHQAHNLTYNIAVEFDGYKERYEWIKKGIDFLIRGTKFNQHQPILQWTLGIYTGQKIGISDEKKQYRQLFRNDEKYHKQLLSEGLDVLQSDAIGIENKPDHWLVGRLWFERSYDLVKAGCPCKKTPHIYYSDGPKCQLRYSESIEEEGVLDDRAKFAWSRGGQQWKEFGQRDILTTWGDTIQLNGIGPAEEAYGVVKKQFEDLAGPVRDKIMADLKAQLPEEERMALDTHPDDRNVDQIRMAGMAEMKITPTPLVVAQACPKEIRNQVIDVATRLTKAKDTVDHITKYRDQVNYQYWGTRADAEQHPITLEARRQMYQADQFLKEAKLDEALASYDDAWVNWDRVFRRFPILLNDEVAIDIMKSINRYKRILDNELPEYFPLAEFVHLKEQNDRKGIDQRSRDWLASIQAEAQNFDESDTKELGRYLQWMDYRKSMQRAPGAPRTDTNPAPAANPPASEPNPAQEPTAKPTPEPPATEAATAASSGPVAAPGANRPPRLEVPAPPDDQ